MQVISQVLFPPLLLATDGSPSAQMAQTLLSAIAQALQAETTAPPHLPPPSLPSLHLPPPTITVLTVQPRRSSRSSQPTKFAASHPVQGTLPLEPNATPSADQPANLPLSLGEAIQARFPPNLTVDLQVRRGRPAIEILNYARSVQAGLIAIGQRGASGGMRELLLGSVSSVIARYAPCSVLLARGSTATPSLQHVLVVIDERAATQQAIAMARQLVPAGIQRITLLCAQSPLNAGYLFGPFVTPTPSWQLSQSLQSALKEQSDQLLHQAKQKLDLPGLDVQTLAQTSEPGPLICQVAQQHRVDLIILGSGATRRSLLAPLQNFRRGKNSEPAKPPLRNTRLSATEDYTIHHAPCSVLLCRTHQRLQEI